MHTAASPSRNIEDPPNYVSEPVSNPDVQLPRLAAAVERHQQQIGNINHKIVATDAAAHSSTRVGRMPR